MIVVLKYAAVLALLLSACGEKQPSAAVSVDSGNGGAKASEAMPVPSPEPRPAPSPGARPPPAEASLPEVPFTPTSAQGAATVVETYYALIEAGKYAEAVELRWDSGKLGLARFKESFAPYAEYHATVGAPSQIQGAAGSLYVEVPVQLYGRLKSGKPFGSVGNVTLRRVNDVPGSTETERRWRIYASK